MGHSRSSRSGAIAPLWWAASLLALVALMGSGWLIEARVFTSSSQWLWMLDLAVGCTFLVCGWVAALPGRQVATSALLLATGIAWFIGTLVPDLALLHRGPLVQLLVTYPGWRPRGRVGWVLIALGYATAVIPALGRNEAATVLLGAALLGYLVMSLRRAHGPERRARAVALGCGLAYFVALVGAIVLVRSDPTSGTAGLVGYSIVLVAMAIAFTLGVGWRRTGSVTDLVVQLGGSPTPVLRDQLAHALRDSTLEVGYWSPVTRDYRDDTGQAVAVGDVSPARVATFVPRDGREFAVVVHDATTLTDPAVAEEIAAAVRLGDRNADLRADVAAQLKRLALSRSHLDNAFVEESRWLESRLASGPIAHLERIQARLERLSSTQWADDPHVARAHEHLSFASLELAQLARGLHARSLSESGLRHSLEQLADGSTVPITVDAPDTSLAPEVETTLWFICAEALANVEKHAGATRAAIRVTVTDSHSVTLTIEDDGRGGADVTAGTGLRGMHDRVESAGGTLAIRSEKGQGTRVRVTLPLAASSQLASPMRTHG